jgi:hypothetical protein
VRLVAAARDVARERVIRPVHSPGPNEVSGDDDVGAKRRRAHGTSSGSRGVNILAQAREICMPSWRIAMTVLQAIYLRKLRNGSLARYGFA